MHTCTPKSFDHECYEYLWPLNIPQMYRKEQPKINPMLNSDSLNRPSQPLPSLWSSSPVRFIYSVDDLLDGSARNAKLTLAGLLCGIRFREHWPVIWPGSCVFNLLPKTAATTCVFYNKNYRHCFVTYLSTRRRKTSFVISVKKNPVEGFSVELMSQVIHGREFLNAMSVPWLLKVNAF